MSIEEICKKYGIENYTINDDGSIDVDGSVNINFYDLTELPLKFGVVTLDFYCSDNKLTTLKGSPKSVGRFFNCSANNLTSLEGCPDSVGHDFECDLNKLTDLKGCPKSVVGGFYCGYNNLTSLEGSPDSVGDNFKCNSNNLTDLKGSPKSIGGWFYCHNNPIGSIFDYADIDFIRSFKTFKVLNDGVVNFKRLKYLTEMFDKPIDLKEIKKYYTIK